MSSDLSRPITMRMKVSETGRRLEDDGNVWIDENGIDGDKKSIITVDLTFKTLPMWTSPCIRVYAHVFAFEAHMHVCLCSYMYI